MKKKIKYPGLVAPIGMIFISILKIFTENDKFMRWCYIALFLLSIVAIVAIIFEGFRNAKS